MNVFCVLCFVFHSMLISRSIISDPCDWHDSSSKLIFMHGGFIVLKLQGGCIFDLISHFCILLNPSTSWSTCESDKLFGKLSSFIKSSKQDFNNAVVTMSSRFNAKLRCKYLTALSNSNFSAYTKPIAVYVAGFCGLNANAWRWYFNASSYFLFLRQQWPRLLINCSHRMEIGSSFSSAIFVTISSVMRRISSASWKLCVCVCAKKLLSKFVKWIS